MHSNFRVSGAGPRPAPDPRSGSLHAPQPVRPSARQRWCVAVAALLCCCGVIRAHEIGTTRVSVLLKEDRAYDIEIVTDASALADKLEASTGGPAPSNLDPAGYKNLLESFDPTFRQRVKVAFDGAEVRPA